MPINHEIKTTYNGREQVDVTYTGNVNDLDECGECEECDFEYWMDYDPNGFLVCRKFGIVRSEKVFSQTYIKPQLKYKTPSWRKPKHYDTKFFELLNKNYPNTTRFNYTRPGSKNHELDGYYNRYKNEYNKEKLIVKDDCLEEGRVVCTCYDLETPTKYGGFFMGDWADEYFIRQNRLHKGFIDRSNRTLSEKSYVVHTYTKPQIKTKSIKPLTPEKMHEINLKVREHRDNLKKRGLTL